MSVLYIVFPLALLLVVAAVLAFIWAVRSGQFDDTQTPAMRVLHDDELHSEATEEKPKDQSP